MIYCGCENNRRRRVLKAIDRAVERFCRKHSRFGVPRLMLYIVIISAVVYLLDRMDTTRTLLSILAFSPGKIMKGELWRLVTWIFCPLNDQLILTALMLYFYYFIGSTLEREWGTAKFTIYYIMGILVNVIYGFIVRFLVGPYWALLLDNLNWLVPNFLNMSMFFAFAVLFPEQVIMLFFFIPVKIKWLALIDVAYFAYFMISDLVNGYVIFALIPLVAILNFIIFCGYDLGRHIKRFRARHSAGRSAGTINFKAAARQARREQEQAQYRHKCAVCGRTDTEYPDLEFRYCSRCEGYHCFCTDHINSHVHFK